MLPPLLGLHNSPYGALQVYKLLGMTPTALGDTLPSSAREDNIVNGYDGLSNRMADFRVVRFRGAYYACSNQGVFKRQPDDSWSMAEADGGLTFVNPALDSGGTTNGYNGCIKGGLFMSSANGKARLAGWYRVQQSAASNHHRGFWLDPDTGEWVLGTSTNVSSAFHAWRTNGVNQPSSWSGLFYQFVHNGSIHILGNTQTNGLIGVNSTHKIYSPATDTWATISNPSGGNVDGQWNRTFCVWQGSMYAIHYGAMSGASPRASLWRLTGGTAWEQALEITLPVSWDSRSVNGKSPLWTDGTDLYFMLHHRQSSADGWRCYRVTPELVASEITTAVMPTGLRLGHSSASGLLPIVDSISDPGQSTIYLMHWPSRSYGSMLSLFRWNGPDEKLTLIDSAANASFAMPHGVISGLYVDSQRPEVVVEAYEEAVDSITISFRAYGGHTNQSVRFYTGDLATTQVPLAGVATGGSAVRNGNQVDNVDADGSTLYSVDLDVIELGLYDGDRINVVGLTA